MLSILLAWGLNRILDWQDLCVPWWIDAPSVFGFYGLLHTLFDHWIWRMLFLRTARVLRIPDLRGSWRGSITSSYDDNNSLDATITIRQTWTHIVITLESEHSKSQSLTASISTIDVDNPELSYEYLNEPKAGAADTMHAHRGTARLTVERGGSLLAGEYYSGRGRQKFGSMRFERSDV